MLADGTFIMWQNVPYEWALRMDESADDDARAKRELRGFIDAEARFLKKYVPGFENSTLMDVGRFVGVRDGRHPVGEYVFSIDDGRNGRKFRDAVTKPMTKTFYWDNHAKYTFEVPFRCFLPKKVKNLILTGASLSFTYDTIFMVMRNFPWCTQTGEIAGLCRRAMHWQEYLAERAGVDDAVFLRRSFGRKTPRYAKYIRRSRDSCRSGLRRRDKS